MSRPRIYKGVHFKSKLQDIGTWWAAAWLPCRLCYRPALFFLDLRLIPLSFHKGTFWRTFVLLFHFLLFKNYLRLEFRQVVSVYIEAVQCVIMHFLSCVRAFVLPLSSSFPWLLRQYLENVSNYNHHCVWFFKFSNGLLTSHISRHSCSPYLLVTRYKFGFPECILGILFV